MSPIERCLPRDVVMAVKFHLDQAKETDDPPPDGRGKERTYHLPGKERPMLVLTDEDCHGCRVVLMFYSEPRAETANDFLRDGNNRPKNLCWLLKGNKDSYLNIAEPYSYAHLEQKARKKLCRLPAGLFEAIQKEVTYRVLGNRN